MTKKTITRYSLPLTDAERVEIQDILKPIYITKEKKRMARELQKGILENVKRFLDLFPTDKWLSDAERLNTLDGEIRRSASDWYDRYAQQLGPSIRPEDIHAGISTDGLFRITVSDTVKQIITTQDFDMVDTVTTVLPQDDSSLMDRVNHYLENGFDEE